MSERPDDIFTEPKEDPNTLARLGPFAPMAGSWRGEDGVDVKPKAGGPRTQIYLEALELVPIDAQTNGPQLLYGLRYHARMVKPGRKNTYHDQVGYWLWEPATGCVIHTLTIPRGQVAMAAGQASAEADHFELHATQGLDTWGICSSPFLDHAFKTTAFRIRVDFHDDGSWSYEEDTVLQIRGRDEPFHHVDRNHLERVAEATPNPLARVKAG